VDLLSTVEIADLFSISRQRVDQLTRTESFPQPLAELPLGRIWLQDHVVEWVITTGRLGVER
jgi:predicted DNA-binding transcriptional regulator AlpA